MQLLAEFEFVEMPAVSFQGESRPAFLVRAPRSHIQRLEEPSFRRERGKFLNACPPLFPSLPAALAPRGAAGHARVAVRQLATCRARREGTHAWHDTPSARGFIGASSPGIDAAGPALLGRPLF